MDDGNDVCYFLVCHYGGAVRLLGGRSVRIGFSIHSVVHGPL